MTRALVIACVQYILSAHNHASLSPVLDERSTSTAMNACATTHITLPRAHHRTSRVRDAVVVAKASARPPASLDLDDRSPGFRRAFAAALAAASLAMTIGTDAALAIPQTSECATNSCDDKDYSGKNYVGTGAFFTKGSLKRANFENANLEGITFFGADLTGANFKGANLANANLGQANLSKADLTNAVLSGAIVSSAQFDEAKIEGSDWSDVIVRKDVLTGLCKAAGESVNPLTGNATAMTLMCP